MSLVRDIIDYMEARGIRAALIGGLSLAAHGVVRGTSDRVPPLRGCWYSDHFVSCQPRRGGTL